MKIAIVFSQFGPYHHARVHALSGCGLDVVPLQIGKSSRTYAWTNNSNPVSNLHTLVRGDDEDAGFLAVFIAAWKVWKNEKIVVAFLPSYWPKSSLALLLSAKLAGVKCIMMNESHAGTQRAQGFKSRIKAHLVSMFEGAIVGGEPHRRYFKSLGMREDMIVTGYDAIDNNYFQQAASEAKKNADQVRENLCLPHRYLLSLGRLVKKKNLNILIDAYAEFHQSNPESDLKLVFVGSGDSLHELTAQCTRRSLKYTLDPKSDDGTASVFFYGFRQIDENPSFYSLCEAFVLPSLYEEWGLVVNEAMACGVPIIVSETVGSSEDLVIPNLNGYHFDPTSVSQLTECIRRLQLLPEIRTQMGKASQEHIKRWGCENFATNAKIILNRVIA